MGRGNKKHDPDHLHKESGGNRPGEDKRDNAEAKFLCGHLGEKREGGPKGYNVKAQGTRHKRGSKILERRAKQERKRRPHSWAGKLTVQQMANSTSTRIGQLTMGDQIFSTRF